MISRWVPLGSSSSVEKQRSLTETLEYHQGLGWKVDFQGADKLTQSVHSDGTEDPDIGVLKKPRLVSRVRLRRSFLSLWAVELTFSLFPTRIGL